MDAQFIVSLIRKKKLELRTFIIGWLSEIASDALKGRIFEVSLADLNKEAEEQAFRKIKLRVDEVQGKNLLTNFHGMDFTSDKLRSLVRKWQVSIEKNGKGDLHLWSFQFL